MEVNGYTNEPNANLSGAYLTGANLVGANLVGANFTAANLTNAYADKATRWPKGFYPVVKGGIIV
ncbi:MAG: pentapeptide repeat-containing protein [Acidimicrobiales bacterium]|nr:pentapeptide repeat-containing protein [Acidimicrobiales bacterium]